MLIVDAQVHIWAPETPERPDPAWARPQYLRMMRDGTLAVGSGR